MTSSPSNQGDTAVHGEAGSEAGSARTTQADIKLSGNYSCCAGFAYYSKRMQEEGNVPVSA